MVKVKKVYPLYSYFEREVDYRKSRRISMSIIGSLFLLLLILNFISLEASIQEVPQAESFINEEQEVVKEYVVDVKKQRKLVADFSDFIIYDGYMEMEVPKERKEIKKVVKKVKVKVKEVKTAKFAPAVTLKAKTITSGSQTSKTKELQSRAATEIVNLMEKYKKYPKQARRVSAEGVANITFSISSQGVVSNVAVSKTSGYAILDKAALEAAKKIIGFNAIKDDSYNQLLTVTVPVDFYLD